MCPRLSLFPAVPVLCALTLGACSKGGLGQGGDTDPPLGDPHSLGDKQAPPPREGATLDLRTVSDNRLLRLLGSSGDGSYGVPVAGGHDLNGDGAQDFAMGAMLASPLGRSGAGEVWLVLGEGSGSGTLDTGVSEPNVLRILGVGDQENTGSELWMDDLTGDGLGDLLIARQNFSPTTPRVGAGALTVVHGTSNLTAMAADPEGVLDLADPPPGITLTTLVGSNALDRLGIWMRTGDITGDGTADLILGADQEDGGGDSERGALYVMRGGNHLQEGTIADLSNFGSTALAGHLLKVIPAPGSNNFHLGATCQVGDLDRNGRAEVLVAATVERAGAALQAAGAPLGSAEASGGAPAGRVYILWDDLFVPSLGDLWDAGQIIDLGNAPGITIIRGGSKNIRFGEELIGGHDYDDDGNSDLFIGDIIGDGSPTGGRPRAGWGILLFDAAVLKGQDFSIDAPPAGLKTTEFLGAQPGHIAADTAAMGDFDGDGIDDLGFSSPHASPSGRTIAGAFHIFFGQRAAWPTLVDLRDSPQETTAATGLHRLDILGALGSVGADQGDTLGYSAATGDLDGDGRRDLITNEMLGNRLGSSDQDQGNLLILPGSLIRSAAGR